MNEDLMFKIPGLDDRFFSVADDLARYDQLLAEAYRKMDARVKARFIEVFQKTEPSHDGQFTSVGRMSVETAALKFGITLGRDR